MQYRFGPFAVDTQERSLRRDVQAVAVAPKAFDLLVALLERPGEVIEKEELLNRVWPDQEVEEGNLTVNISSLRKVLGERAGQQRYVVTVPGRGYKFGAPVETAVAEAIPTDQRVSAPVPTGARASRLARPLLFGVLAAALALTGSAYLLWVLASGRSFVSGREEIRSVAVLPFRTLVTHDRDEALELGLADMVSTRISNLRELVVRPIAAVRRYAGPEQDPLLAGRELQVQSVVEGTIHTVGDRVRVTVRLLRVRDGASLWADRFDEPASDILRLEDSISERVARALRRHLADTEAQRIAQRPTASGEAHRLYLAGRYEWNKMTAEGQKASIRFFEQAVSADPRYALAYAGLSDAYVSLAADVLPPADAMSKARRAAISALELDESLSEPHVSLGRVKAYYDWDWAGAGREFDRAVSLAPNSPDAHRERGLYLTSVGRVAEAISETKQSWELDPLSPMTNFALGWALMGARRYDEVLEHLRRFREVHPSHPTAFMLVGLAYIGQRRYADAVAEYERALKLYPRDLLFKAQYGFSCAAAGRTREAEAVLVGLNAPSETGEVSRYYTAVVKAGLHRNEEAIADLHSAYNARSRRLWALNVVPTWDELRLDSRFRALVTRIGLS